MIHIGDVPMGGDYPIRVQSMTNTLTLDTKATVEQAIRMIEAGCEYVRISVPGMKEVENLTRRYTWEISPMIGPEKDIPAPDVNTTAQHMAWIMDTYSIIKGYPVPGVVTGKPISIGGSNLA